MTTAVMSTTSIAVTIPITTEMVGSLFATSLPDGEFVKVMLDDKFESPVACFVVTSASPALTVERIWLYSCIPDTVDTYRKCYPACVYSDRVTTSSSRCYLGHHFWGAENTTCNSYQYSLDVPLFALVTDEVIGSFVVPPVVAMLLVTIGSELKCMLTLIIIHYAAKGLHMYTHWFSHLPFGALGILVAVLAWLLMISDYWY